MDRATNEPITNSTLQKIQWYSKNLEDSESPGNVKDDLGWVIADVYVKIETTITASGFLQVYTDNTNSANSHYYSGNENPAGLLASLPTSNATDSLPLPMAWRVVDSTSAFPVSASIYRGAECKGQSYDDWIWVSTNTAGTTGYNNDQCYPSFFWITDARGEASGNGDTTSWLTASDYARVKEAGKGIQHTSGYWVRTTSPDYLYFAADFSYALAGRDYSANIILEWVSE
jgi:hypothetical protein